MSPRNSPRVLILDQVSFAVRKGPIIARSLGRVGIHVGIASTSFRSGTSNSRFVKKRHRTPRCWPGSSELLEALTRLARQESYDAIIPVNESPTLALAHAAKQLPSEARTAVPSVSAVELAKDKVRTMQIADEIGLATPTTWLPRDIDQLESLALELPYPCIIKPRVTAGAFGQSTAGNASELIKAWRNMPGFLRPTYNPEQPMVQQPIDGQVHEVCCLFHHGEPRALLTQKRLIMQPISGGPGIFNETTDEPDLKELAVKLLGKLKWHGPAQVEFIREKGSNTPYLLEINGRFWGTLALSVAAGMDFPLLTTRMALDGDVEPQHDYRVGHRHRWILPFALRHALETGNWAQTARQFLLPASNTTSDFDWRDPAPQAMEFVYALQRTFHGRKKIS